MPVYGMELGSLITLLLNLTILLCWPVLSVLALLDLRRRRLSEAARPFWAILVVAIPFLGPVAFWMVGPRQSAGQST